MATPAAVTADDVRRLSEERGIEFYFAQFVDLYARPSAKLVPAANLDDLLADGAGFAGFAAGEIGQLPSDPDLARFPTWRASPRCPGSRPSATSPATSRSRARSGRTDPRTILRRVLDRARGAGYEFKIGLELEYFLVREHGDGGISSPTRSTPSRSPATT